MKIKKQQLEQGMEQWTGSKLGKEYVKAILSPCLFNLYAGQKEQLQLDMEQQTGTK